MKIKARHWGCLVVAVVALCTAAAFFYRWSRSRQPLAAKILSLNMRANPICVWASPNVLGIMSVGRGGVLAATMYKAAGSGWVKCSIPESGTTPSTLEQKRNAGLGLKVECVDGNSSAHVRIPLAGKMFPGEGGIMVASAASEDENRLAYIVKTKHYFPGALQLRRLFPGLDISEHTDVDLWAGSAVTYPRLVGRLINDVPADTMLPLSSLQWTPDNRRISFIYDGVLYVSPAE